MPEQHDGLFRFAKGIIAFRKANRALRQPEFLTGQDLVGSGYPDISWHGVLPWKPDWSLPSRTLAFLLCGRHGASIGGQPHFIYCAFNMYYEPLEFTLPVLPKGQLWYQVVDTALESPNDIVEPGQERPLGDVKTIKLQDRSSVILVGRFPA
jgi:glycogen operon protein